MEIHADIDIGPRPRVQRRRHRFIDFLVRLDPLVIGWNAALMQVTPSRPRFPHPLKLFPVNAFT
jgi:hypothetical protein